MPELDIYDLDQWTPPEQPFKIRGVIYRIAPVFSTEDMARYRQIDERLAYQRQYTQQLRLSLASWQLRCAEARERGDPEPEAPEPLPRSPQFPYYSDEDWERDVFRLLTRVWQASEAVKLPEERITVDTAFVRDLLNVSQAWALLNALWPHRYSQREPVVVRQETVEPPAAEPEPVKQPRRRRSAASSLP